jgi:hypothetical protein
MNNIYKLNKFHDKRIKSLEQLLNNETNIEQIKCLNKLVSLAKEIKKTDNPNLSWTTITFYRNEIARDEFISVYNKCKIILDSSYS